MPEYTEKTSKILGLNKGLTVLLAGADLDLLFSYRLSTVVEAIEGIVKAASRTLKKCDDKYVEKKNGKPVPVLDDEGKKTGQNKIEESKRDEWEGEKDKILDDPKSFTCPPIEMKDLLDAQNEDGVPIPGWVIHSLRPVIKVSESELKKAGGDGKAGKEKASKKPEGRAANVKAKKEAEESEEE